MHGRAKGTADYYWPWAVFFKILNLGRAADPKGMMSYITEGGISIRPLGAGAL